MNAYHFPSLAMALLTLTMLLGGCGNPTTSEPGTVEASSSSTTSGDVEGHQGPHGGHVIDLGRSHEYHAELVENEAAGTVTVYILDGAMKELAIDQSLIEMNLIVDGQAKSFELAAAGATDGTASQFNATDKALFTALHEHEADGKLRVTINGVPYSGDIAHHQDEH